jgi:polyphosphate glucokinase
MSRIILMLGVQSQVVAGVPTSQSLLAVGVDVGGTAVKAGKVDLSSGTLVGSPQRLATPRPALVGDVLDTASDAVRLLEQAHGDREFVNLAIGVGLSGDVRDGEHTSGVNLDPSWVGAPARRLLEARLGRSVRIVNDADAAGIGEIRYGAGRGVRGVVVLLTFGTGVGSAIFHDGRLLPNSGFGQFPFHGGDVELSLSAAARERRRISWQQWARELNDFLACVDGMLRPDLIILGGGASEAWPEYAHNLRPSPPVVRAALGNLAGVVGAAAFAAGRSEDELRGPDGPDDE